MADIVDFSKTPPDYQKSVNTPDYQGNPDVLINPDVSQVVNIERKYWKRDGDTIAEMDTTEKRAVLDAELAVRKAQIDDFSIDSVKIVLTALIKVINQRLPREKKITKQEMIDALKNEIT
jgi:hypothetical protein